MPTAAELMSDLEARMRDAAARMRSPLMVGNNAELATAAIERLEAGADAATNFLNLEADAGQSASADFRALSDTVDRANEVAYAGRLALARVSTGQAPGITATGGQQPAGTKTGAGGTDAPRQPPPQRRAPAQRAPAEVSTWWLIGSGAAALGAVWLFLKLTEKKPHADAV